MSKKDPLDPKNVKTTRFEISADELEARMQRQQEMHVEPIQKAVALLTAALEKVMKKLGVDTTLADEVVRAQQEFLGISVMENTEESQPQLNGFYVYVGYDEFIPYCWIGAARLNSAGECFVDIQYFEDNRLEETGGLRLIK